MAISETQLSTWSNQGAMVASAQTYNSIQACINAETWNNDVSYNIYLQGSYKNSTNTRGDSDVDVVLEFTSTFYSNKSELSLADRLEYEEYHSNAKYSLSDYKLAVIETLENYYGKLNVKVGSKSIKVIGGNGRLDADVVCCATYRKYNSFGKNNRRDYVEGIIFWDGSGNKVINFPNKHFRHGATKNSLSNNNYKPTVRMVKNIKSKLVADSTIISGLAPSYFIECLLYNVPASVYKETTNQKRLIGILSHFLELDKSGGFQDLICQNNQLKLFGTSDQQWDVAEAKQFLQAVLDLWNQ
ncbi:MAG: nucleotidyltransferase [Gammaproteobacteria bacterium]|nr:nucleotidyltransferase [Gammaproteobacteria bacterium]